MRPLFLRRLGVNCKGRPARGQAKGAGRGNTKRRRAGLFGVLLLKPETSGLGTARRVEGMGWGSFASLGVVKSKNIKPEMIPSLALQSFEYILTNGIWIDRKAGRILAGSAPPLFTPDLISGRAPQPTDAFHPVSRSLATNRPLARWPGLGLAGLFLDLNLLGCLRTSKRPNRHTTH